MKAGQSQSGRYVCNIIVCELSDPIPGPSPWEGKGARRAERGVYSGKIFTSAKMINFAIALFIIPIV